MSERSTVASSTDALVVDASVAAKWLLEDEEYADIAALLLRHFAAGRTELVAPGHIRYEVASAVAVAARGKPPRINPEKGQRSVERFLALGLRIEDDDALILEAYPLVYQYDCALYDAIYLALAQRLALPLLTADRRLYQRIRHFPNVLWIGNYSPPDE